MNATPVYLVILLITSVLGSLRFTQLVVDDKLKDDHWIEAFDVDNDGFPDLVTSGGALGVVSWYKNPGSYSRCAKQFTNREQCVWHKKPIIKLSNPVAIDHADIDGDGFLDIAISHDYGGSGTVSWLKNPGNVCTSEWERRDVGNVKAVHRLKIGKFTQSKKNELMVLPVLGDGDGEDLLHSPVRIQLFAIPDHPLENSPWKSTLVDSSFRVVNGVVGFPTKRKGLDSVLIASKEGVSWLYYKQKQAKWTLERFGNEIDASSTSTSEFKGSGDVAIGRSSENNADHNLVLMAETFQNTIASYYKRDDKWTQQVLKQLDPEGQIHHIVAIDFDKDGKEEFVVAARGTKPYQGVTLIKPFFTGELVSFHEENISTQSAARIAVADFNNDGKMDFVTIGYFTPGSFVSPDPGVIIYYNRYDEPSLFTPSEVSFGVTPTLWVNDDNQLLGHDMFQYETIINEMALAGYVGSGIGHKYPKTTKELISTLKMRGLRVTEPWVSTYFTVKAMAKKTEEEFFRILKKIQALGGNRIVVAELGHASHLSPVDLFANKPNYTDAQWDSLATGLNKIGKFAAENGMELCFHHHMGTGVQTLEEIDTLMSKTDGRYVKLAFDSGHALFAGVNPLDIIKKHPSRIRHVHLKNIRQGVLDRVHEEGMNFFDAVDEGVFTVMGDIEGCIDFEPILKELSLLNYTGWIIVEGEQDPAKAHPFTYAKIARAELYRIVGF